MALRPMVFVLALVCAACAAASAPAPVPPPLPVLEGYWSGRFERGGGSLPVELQFARDGGALSGRFSSPDLRAIGIPLRDVRQDAGHVHFVLAGDASTAVFDGALNADALSGDYSESGAPGHFTFTRATPPRTCRDVPAQFSNDAVMLAGDLLLPEHTPAPASVLMLHGSGAEGRDATRFEATLLCREGFAALIYDKRGVGASTGDWRESGFDDLADDAIAALNWLATRPEIDAAHIGLYGHSQGAMIAPVIATRWPRLAFVIAGAAAGQRPPEVERYSLRSTVSAGIHSDAERREAYSYVDRVVAAGATGRGLAGLLSDAPRYASREWYIPLPPADSYYWRFQRRIASFDPAHYWAHVTAPVLLIYGADDARVAPAASLTAIQAALPRTTPVETLIIAGGDHSYMLHPSGDAWPHLAPQFPQAFLRFVRAHAAS